jgi:hypothetical protein
MGFDIPPSLRSTAYSYVSLPVNTPTKRTSYTERARVRVWMIASATVRKVSLGGTLNESYPNVLIYCRDYFIN